MGAESDTIDDLEYRVGQLEVQLGRVVDVIGGEVRLKEAHDQQATDKLAKKS